MERAAAAESNDSTDQCLEHKASVRLISLVGAIVQVLRGYSVYIYTLESKSVNKEAMNDWTLRRLGDLPLLLEELT